MHGLIESSALLLLGVSKSYRYDSESSRITLCFEAHSTLKLNEIVFHCQERWKIIEQLRIKKGFLRNFWRKDKKRRAGCGQDPLFYCLMGFYSIPVFPCGLHSLCDHRFLLLIQQLLNVFANLHVNSWVPHLNGLTLKNDMFHMPLYPAAQECQMAVVLQIDVNTLCLAAM